ncbi:hypothetical protein [Microvirga makkahensis]|uniref:Uncharacterized protein n=1 Tax=Microvirga makkahensis TaxID=1128670 RepID=A0A7X3MXS6_9HYPH|nr:hypothetical protein [Microvirga makkahensis]MXQ14905.1 hypothetical protein [Microvirga makkahensis]
MTYLGDTLTLQGISPQAIVFAGRPERVTGDASTAKFIEFWTSGKSDLEKDPPNATLSAVVEGKPQLPVVELSNPQLNGTSPTYKVKVPGDRPPPATSGAASPFIDWWAWHPGPSPGPWGVVGVAHTAGCCRPAWAW